MSKSHDYFRDLAWDKIVWSNSHSRVRRIQKRIYKASRIGDKGKMTFMQKMLLRSPHAKLIAVQSVTTLNKGKKTPGIDGLKATSGEQKLALAKSLSLNGKANPVKRIWIPKPGKTEKRPLGIPTIRDRAKQALCKLALEPQWEAKFETNSYGFRPGRSSQDAIEAIFLNLHFNVDKYVFDADIRKCFDQIDHDALLGKLDTFPLMKAQVSAWLKAGIFDEYASTPGVSESSTVGTPQGGVISPLLANIALHGLEDHLSEFVSKRNMPKPHEGASKGSRAKRAALGVVRYADDFVVIHRNLDIMRMVIQETKTWLNRMGLSISDEKSSLKKASQTFKFLGFQVAYVKSRVSGKFRVKITPSRENICKIVTKVKSIIQNNKAVSSYHLIGKIRPVILGWANYFQYCECKEVFSKVDNTIYQQIRAWVFRRAVRQGRKKVKEKYFPSGNTYPFQGRLYKANWILFGTKKLAGDKKSTIYLPKLSWVNSKNYVKIKGDASVYDGNEIYCHV
jgi:RNA-directed DNA polymerase